MSIFGTILTKIFHHGEAAAAPAGSPPAAPQASAGAAPDNKGRPPLSSESSPAQRTQSAQDDDPTVIAASGSTPPMASASVDVAQILDGLAAKNGQKLDWKHSIVDMMKLLDLDSGLGARQELARELGYTGNTHDSAAMNVWLHKQVMQKLAANGGKVPDDLKA